MYACMLSASVMSDPWTIAKTLQPMDCGLSGSSVHGIFQVGCHFLLQENLPDPGIKPMSLCFLQWQVDSLPFALSR